MFWFFKNKKEDYDSKINSLDNLVKTSFSNVKDDMTKVSNWIKFFKTNEIKQDDQIKELNNKLERLISEVSSLKVLYEKAPEPERSIERSSRSIVHERVQSFNRSNQSFMNVQSSLKGSFTPAQKKIISVLTVSDIPLEYENIAKELKLNIITVRRHINDIKRIGFDIKEKVSVDNGRKVFYLEKELKKSILSKK